MLFLKSKNRIKKKKRKNINSTPIFRQSNIIINQPVSNYSSVKGCLKKTPGEPPSRRSSTILRIKKNIKINIFDWNAFSNLLLSNPSKLLLKAVNKSCRFSPFTLKTLLQVMTWHPTLLNETRGNPLGNCSNNLQNSSINYAWYNSFCYFLWKVVALLSTPYTPHDLLDFGQEKVLKK